MGQFISDHPRYFFQTLRVQNIKMMSIIYCSRKTIKHTFSFQDNIFDLIKFTGIRINKPR